MVIIGLAMFSTVCSQFRLQKKSRNHNPFLLAVYKAVFPHPPFKSYYFGIKNNRNLPLARSLGCETAYHGYLSLVVGPSVNTQA